jgi:hypothetical protein
MGMKGYCDDPFQGHRTEDTKNAYNSDFEKRMKEFTNGVRTNKPHRTKFLQQQYTCCCPTMRMYRRDIVLSTCKDCISNGFPIINCQTYKCQCQTSIFIKKDIIMMATNKLQNDELKAACKHVSGKDECTHQNFAGILLSLVRKGFKSLLKSNSRLDEKNVLSAAAQHMSRQQMPSMEELQSLQ